MNENYITITDVSFAYSRDAALVLHGVHLTIPQGKIFGVLGPNGAGKSTLLALMSGILPLQSGSIRIARKSLPADIREIRAMSAIVPQEYAFYERLTVQENLRFFASLLYADTVQQRRRVDDCIKTCQLQEAREKIAGKCSGGIKRRLNLAIGLLGNPQLLYLDEPTVGIDAQSRRFILESIRRLRDQGVTIIYTSHYFEEVVALCDSVAIIDHGRVVYQGDNVRDMSGSKPSLEDRFLQMTGPVAVNVPDKAGGST